MSSSGRIQDVPSTRSATTATPRATTPKSAARAPPRTIGTWYAGIRSSARHDDAARAGHDRISVAAMCRSPRAAGSPSVLDRVGTFVEPNEVPLEADVAARGGIHSDRVGGSRHALILPNRPWSLPP